MDITRLFKKEEKTYAAIEMEDFRNGLFQLTIQEDGRKITYMNYVPGEVGNRQRNYQEMNIGKEAYWGETVTIEKEDLEKVIVSIDNERKNKTVIIEDKNRERLVVEKYRVTEKQYSKAFLGGVNTWKTAHRTNNPAFTDRDVLRTLEHYENIFKTERRKFDVEHHRKKIVQSFMKAG